jgi:integrase
LWRFVVGKFSAWETNMAKCESEVSFRVGRVKAYRRNKIWYLCYHEEGKRRRPRIGADRSAARRMAAQINGQLETGAISALAFEPILIADLRGAWLKHHNTVRRSSLSTINRYRTATEHLLRFLEERPIRVSSQFRVCHAEEFVAHLRSLRVAPNGHPNSEKRPLLDKGILFILETCRALFTYAAKRRHLPPYSKNPFSALELGKLPIDHRRRISLPTDGQLTCLFDSMDDWSFGIFSTLALTGLRSGELVHLLVEDFDSQNEVLHIRNRPNLGWQVKTRQDRTIPLLAAHAQFMKRTIGSRLSGTLFQRMQFSKSCLPAWGTSSKLMEAELNCRQRSEEQAVDQSLSRKEVASLCRQMWLKMGMIKPDQIRTRLMRHSRKAGLEEIPTPKMFRHLFATMMQAGRVDPLIRNELLGHIPESGPRAGGGLGMTANYTHTEIGTKREQMRGAFQKQTLWTAIERRFRHLE